jgi:hypothetical protein
VGVPKYANHLGIDCSPLRYEASYPVTKLYARERATLARCEGDYAIAQ